ncbi:HAD family hydrolase [Candidatus Woesearchaeota archaeon]|nr:HAD family hydrolase [Candidatus Woesearchaeota archaeon]
MIDKFCLFVEPKKTIVEEEDPQPHTCSLRYPDFCVATAYDRDENTESQIYIHPTARHCPLFTTDPQAAEQIRALYKQFRTFIPEGIEAVLFDVDGVLIDSLGPHVDFCRDMNERFNVGLTVPLPEDGKQIAGNPMDNFLRNAGFPEELISEIMGIYEREFGTNYPVRPFPAAHNMLAMLNMDKVKTRIVSSNNRANVDVALEKSLQFVDSIYTIDTCDGKADGIHKTLEDLSVQPNRTVFVGDTLKDYRAARENNVYFIGVSYGWEIGQEHDHLFPVKTSVPFLIDKLKELVKTRA